MAGTLIQWVGIFFTQFSTVIFNLIAGLMFLIMIAGWMFGISAGVETLQLLVAFSKKHSDICQLEKSFAQGGVIYVLDKLRMSIRLQVPYSEEYRRKNSQYARENDFSSKSK